MLLPDLENIKHIMIEKYNEKLKAKVKATMARADGRGKPKKGTSGRGSSDQVPKKAHTEKFCQQFKIHGGPHQMHNMSNCCHYDKQGR